jgi:sporulation protein YlmC with PRC-barrel domain
MTIMKDTEITGKRVIMEDASAVGTIGDVYIDTLDWRITRFDIKLEKRYAARVGVEKGLLKKPVIQVPIHFLKNVHDVAHLKGGIEDLARSQKTILPAAERRKELERQTATKAPAAKAPPQTRRKPAAPAPKKQEKKPRRL